MTIDDLLKHIDEIINKQLDETSTTGGEAYLGKNAFPQPGKASDYLVRVFGFTKAKKPKNLKTFDIVKFNEIKDVVKKELINEISYRRFSQDVSKITSERKISRALNEVRKRLREIEQVIEYSQRLKTENTIKKETFWVARSEQLNMLSERMNQLSIKIRNLSQ